MDTIDAIKKRRSIREFKSDDIPSEVVEDILRCGSLAPSAKNRQPWYFVVLKDEIKNKVADMMIEYTINTDETEERKLLNAPSTVNNSARVIKQAPILILVFKEKYDAWIVSDNLSIGACIENMLLRATELGLGSLWIRDICYVSKKVAEMLGHIDLELNCAVSLGVPNQEPNPRPRKELKDIVEWY